MAEQLFFDLPSRPAFEREAFMVTQSNAEAVALIDQAAHWPVPVQWIYGPSGCGKTHLAAVLAQDFDVHIVHANGLHKNADVSAILGGELSATIVILEALDDLQTADEESLFHLMNHARHGAQKLLIMSQAPAARLNIGLLDLQSRLKAIAAIAMGPPDDELVAGLLNKLFGDLQLRVDDRVIAYLVPRIERDFTSMGQVVKAIDRQALALKKPVTVPLVADVLTAYL